MTTVFILKTPWAITRIPPEITGGWALVRVVFSRAFAQLYFCRNVYLTYISDILVIHSTQKCYFYLILEYFVNDSLYF